MWSTRVAFAAIFALIHVPTVEAQQVDPDLFAPLK